MRRLWWAFSRCFCWSVGAACACYGSCPPMAHTPRHGTYRRERCSCSRPSGTIPMALGALAGLTATGVLSALAPQTTVHAYAGPVLLGWTCLLVISNLYAAGRNTIRLVESHALHTDERG